MIGVLINVVAVIVGSLVGVLTKKGIPDKISKGIMIAMGLVVIYIGLDGALQCNKIVVLIVSMALGSAVGFLIDIDNKLERLGNFVNNKFNKKGSTTNLSEGFVTATLLFCVGAMAIVGSIESGLLGNHKTLITKSIIDMISACMLASTLGIGVALSAVVILIYQGGIALASGLLQSLLTSEALISEITACGSLMIFALGLNMVGATKIKVANFLPAIVFVPFIYKLVQLLPI